MPFFFILGSFSLSISFFFFFCGSFTVFISFLGSTIGFTSSTIFGFSTGLAIGFGTSSCLKNRVKKRYKKLLVSPI